MNPYGITHDPAPALPRGLCEGRTTMFDSTNPQVAALARVLCDACPVLSACRLQRDDWLGSSTTARSQVEGTWAGRTYGEDYTTERRREAARRAGEASAAAKRASAPRTHCKRGHALDDGNLYTNPGSGKRQCRQCRNISVRAFRQRQQAEQGAVA